MNETPISIFWLRRDLRLHDNAGLYHALKFENPVLPLFIFDKNILEELPETDARVTFIWDEIHRLKAQLENELGSSVLIRYGNPVEIFETVLKEYNVKQVFANRDYEPYALKRDRAVYEFLQQRGIAFKAFKDHVLLDRNEVLKDDGTPYTVFTPYMRRYKEKLTDFHLRSYPTGKYFHNFFKTTSLTEIPLEEMGFERAKVSFPEREIDEGLIANYDKTRDFPAIKGTTRLSVHLRFGTISIRELARVGLRANTKFFNELIWRDFYQMILYHYPDTVTDAFRPKYDHVRWENNEEYFQKWCEGKTGYPLVDAGMRELNATGYMHNRVRMVVASFLTKHLLIDWRWGEAYFAKKLLDYEAASNVGGWQWAAGSGVDAAPYFRVFNPQLQLEKFDKDLRYVKKWIPELDTPDYPAPVVDHKTARQKAIDTYKEALA